MNVVAQLTVSDHWKCWKLRDWLDRINWPILCRMRQSFDSVSQLRKMLQVFTQSRRKAHPVASSFLEHQILKEWMSYSLYVSCPVPVPSARTLTLFVYKATSIAFKWCYRVRFCRCWWVVSVVNWYKFCRWCGLSVALQCYFCHRVNYRRSK